MDTTVLDLEKLLAPHSTGAFFQDSWERQPLTIQRENACYYAGLFSLGDVDHVIAFSRPRFTERGVFAGSPPLSRSCVQGWLPEQLGTTDAARDVAELRQVFEQGKTIIIRSMQYRWPAIASLCRNLEAVFHCPVHGNLYLTPPKSQGFDAHIDAHEVFALQLDGVKHWRLYGPAAILPLAGEKANIPREQLGSLTEVCLRPGDLLYIPRGVAHEAFTSEQSSLHLTVGINVYRWADLLHKALDDVSRRDPRFRESLPLRALAGGGTSNVIRARMEDLLAAFADGACADAAIRRLGTEFFDELATLPNSCFVSARTSEIDLNTTIHKSPGAICRVFNDEDSSSIQFPGGQVRGPARIAEALRFIAEATAAFVVRDLPDSLGNEGKLVLTRRLIREGLLMAAENAEEAPSPDWTSKVPSERTKECASRLQTA